MTSAFGLLLLMVTASALVFHFMPRFSRPTSCSG